MQYVIKKLNTQHAQPQGGCSLAKMRHFSLQAVILLGALLWAAVGAAQQGGVNVEDLYDQFEQQAPSPAVDDMGDAGIVNSAPSAKASKTTGVPGRVTDLADPEAFKDVIVLQRRFLPKTKRLEFSLLGQMDLDNPFGVSMGPEARLAGYFLEGHGVELHYSRLFQPKWLKRPMGKALNDMSISIVHYSPRQSFGAAYKWQPFYGKMAWFDEKIISFDLYFTLGWAMATREQEKAHVDMAAADSAATNYVVRQKAQLLTFGMGQLLAFGKSWGVRWDLAHNRLLTAQCSVAKTTPAGRERRVLQDYDPNGGSNCRAAFGQAGWTLSVGASYFFPKAKYR